MAYGSWQTITKRVRTYTVSNKYTYDIDLVYDVRQDPIANKSEIKTRGFIITQENYPTSSYGGTSITCGLGINGVRKTKAFKILKAVETEFLDPSFETSIVLDNNKNGYATFNLEWCCSTWVTALAVKTWQTVETNTPTVDRSAGSATLHINEITPTNVYLTYTPNVSINTMDYSIDNGSTWINLIDGGLNANSNFDFEINGLSSNTQYNIKIRHQRKYNEIVYTSGNTSFKTLAIPEIKNIVVTPSGRNVNFEVVVDGDSSFVKEYVHEAKVYSPSGEHIFTSRSNSRSYIVTASPETVILYSCYIVGTDGTKSKKKEMLTSVPMTPKFNYIKIDGKWVLDTGDNSTTMVKIRNGWRNCAVYVKTSNGWMWRKM